MYAISKREDGHLIGIKLKERKMLFGLNSDGVPVENTLEYFSNEMIDLTLMFGEGNEPNFDELDKVFGYKAYNNYV